MKTYKNSHIQSLQNIMLKKLTEKDAITLRSLSKQLDCSFFAAKRRMAEWVKESGVKLKTTIKREGEKGPASKAFYVSL